MGPPLRGFRRTSLLLTVKTNIKLILTQKLTSTLNPNLGLGPRTPRQSSLHSLGGLMNLEWRTDIEVATRTVDEGVNDSAGLAIGHAIRVEGRCTPRSLQLTTQTLSIDCLRQKPFYNWLRWPTANCLKWSKLINGWLFQQRQSASFML